MSPEPRITFDAAGVPEQLRTERRWFVWRYLRDDGGTPKKPPYDFRTGQPCNSNDPALYATFEEALAAYQSGKYGGLGFGLGTRDGFVCVDLDECRDLQTGEITPAARRIIEDFTSYTEVSPSGDGVKIFIRSHFMMEGGHKKPGVEILTSNYSTVTGRHLKGTPQTIETRAPELRALLAREFGVTGPDKTPQRAAKSLPAEIGGGSRNNDLFAEACRLRHGGHSETEILATLLAMNRTRVHPPLSEDEVGKIARSAARYSPGNADFIVYQTGSRMGQVVPDQQHNIRTGLERLGLGFRFDAFANVALVDWEGQTRRLEDALLHRAWLLLDETFHFRPSLEFFQIVVGDLARRRSFHPVRDYLASLTWDRTPRLNTWLTTYAAAPDTAYTQAVGRLFLLAAVRRVFSPGCKFDELLTLESEQGKLKSQALRALCPQDDWFSDDLPLGVDAKQIIERTAGKWIIEASELQGYSGSEVERLKGMLARQVDGPVRLAYGRMATEVARQFVIAGTTNNLSEYLRDSTGNRRFWPVRIQVFDVPALKRDRDQLWAETVVLEAQGASIRLPEHLWPAAAAQQDARREIDPWEELLDERLDLSRVAILVSELWRALGPAATYYKRSDAARISQIMQRQGFTRKKKVDVVYIAGALRTPGPRTSAWIREGHDPSVVEVRHAFSESPLPEEDVPLGEPPVDVELPF